uniref:hypothetical protein n=1 Tax=Flavobacterium sp. TaxID=239 RepID=UPI004049A83A
MSNYFKEKELSAIEGKIKSASKELNLFIKNLPGVVLFGGFFSLLAPQYSGFHYMYERDSILQISKLQYDDFVVLIGISYAVLCFLLHFVFNYQTKKKIEKLQKRKMVLEQELLQNER